MGQIKKQQLDESCFDHTHDTRYYTKTEIDTKLSDGLSSDHTHDDRYYTESEIDTKLADKASLTGATFTGAVTASELTVTTKLTIPGGQIWIE